MFDYIVRLLVWAVEGGGAKVSLHPVHVLALGSNNDDLFQYVINVHNMRTKMFIYNSI